MHERPDPEVIDRAARLLAGGGLVAFPTETVYGLGAAAHDVRAVGRIFAAKGRPSEHPLIVHVAHRDALEGWARALPDAARHLAALFWPGPLTLILPRRAGVPDAVTGGLETVGLRVPDHPVASALIAALGDGVAAPSANRFGRVSPTTAAHVALELGASVDLILDGGACRVGVESTIVDFPRGRARVLRPGGVSREDLARALGEEVPYDPAAAVRAPGTLPSHYAPRAEVIAAAAGSLERVARAQVGRVVVLAPAPIAGLPHLHLPATPEAAAQRLYAALREVDDAGYEVAVVALPIETGVGEAVVDRIRRASAPRPNRGD